MGVNGVHLTNTTLLENLSNATIQYNTLKQLVSKFKPDGIFSMMDLTVEAEALGLKINFSDNESPSVAEHSVKTLSDLKKLKESWKGINGRMNVFIEVVQKMSENSSIINGAYVSGPLTLAGELMGVNELMMSPEVYEEFSLKPFKKIPENVFLIGNLNPVDVFLNSTPEEVMEATNALKNATKEYNNFILSSGCDLPKETSDNNLEAFMNAARQ